MKNRFLFLLCVIISAQHNIQASTFDGDFQTRLFMYEDSSFMHAIALQNMDLVQKLIKEGADIHEQTERGQTALIAAVDSKNIDLVKMMLDLKINPNIQDHKRQTALMIAASHGLSDIVDLLLEHGVDTSLTSDYEIGSSAISCAWSKKHFNIVRKLSKYEGSIVPSFKKHPEESPECGQEIDAMANMMRTNDKETLASPMTLDESMLFWSINMMDAIEKKKIAKIKILFEALANSSCQQFNEDLYTCQLALIPLAVALGDQEVITTLIDCNAPFNATNLIMTLASAAQCNDKHMVDFLINHIASTKQTDCPNIDIDDIIAPSTLNSFIEKGATFTFMDEFDNKIWMPVTNDTRAILQCIINHKCIMKQF